MVIKRLLKSFSAHFDWTHSNQSLILSSICIQFKITAYRMWTFQHIWFQIHGHWLLPQKTTAWRECFPTRCLETGRDSHSFSHKHIKADLCLCIKCCQSVCVCEQQVVLKVLILQPWMWMRLNGEGDSVVITCPVDGLIKKFDEWETATLISLHRIPTSPERLQSENWWRLCCSSLTFIADVPATAAVHHAE